MVRRSILPSLVTALCAAMISTAVQAQPSSLPRSLTGASSIDESGRERIRRYGEAWLDALESTDRDRIHEARGRLTDPLRLGASDAFRFTYGELLVPMLEPLMAADDTHAAVNAVQITGMIKTDRALGALVDQADINNESRPIIRRHAATLAGVIVRDVRAERIDLPQARVHASLRALSRAAERETEWLVLVQQLNAMAELQDDFGWERLASTLDSVLERIHATDEPNLELMRAVHPTLVRLRNDMIEMSDEQRRQLGRRVAPVLGRVFNVVDRHWEAGRNGDDALFQAISGAVQDSERLLAFLDPAIRGASPTPPTPQTNLHDAWNNADRQRFADDTERWNDVLQSNAYARR